MWSWASYLPLLRLYSLISRKGAVMPPVGVDFRVKRENAGEGMKLDWCLPNGTPWWHSCQSAHGLVGVSWPLRSLCRRPTISQMSPYPSLPFYSACPWKAGRKHLRVARRACHLGQLGCMNWRCVAFCYRLVCVSEAVLSFRTFWLASHPGKSM